jgi:hypothetical protein
MTKIFNEDDLMDACLDFDLELVDKLKEVLKNECDCNEIINEFLLMGASATDKIDSVKKLINQGFNSENQLEDALCEACYSSNLNMVKFFIEEQNVSLEKPTTNERLDCYVGYRCVLRAVDSYHGSCFGDIEQVKIVEYLKSKGVNIHDKNDELFNTMVSDDRVEKFDMFELFVNSGSNIETAINNGTKKVKEWATGYLLKEYIKNKSIKNNVEETDIVAMLVSEDKTALHKHLGIKNHTNIEEFVKDYVSAVNGGDKREIFNTLATSDKLLPRGDEDFEKNGIFYSSGGGKIKKVSQKEDIVSITLSTTGGYKLSNSSETGGTPDFSLVFSLKENVKINVEKGDVIDFLGYSDDKLVLVLKGKPLKVNNLDINEIHATKLNNKIKDETINNEKKRKPKL